MDIFSYVFHFVLGLFAGLGLIDFYIAYRYVRKPGVDKTSGWLTWWFLKWAMATQGSLVAEKLGFPSKDLTEILKFRDDDKIT